MTVYLLPLAWAEDLIAAGRALGDVPPYGSAAWLELPDTDRRKVAACVLAAEGWRHGENIPRPPEPYGDTWRGRVAAAREPRPQDFSGGPVEWDGGPRQ